MLWRVQTIGGEWLYLMVLIEFQSTIDRRVAPRSRYVLIELQALDPSPLPPDNVLAMIAKFEQAQSPEEVDELVALLADWLERVGEPDLVERFRAWTTLVVAQRFGSAGRELELKLRKEEEGKMTTLIGCAYPPFEGHCDALRTIALLERSIRSVLGAYPSLSHRLGLDGIAEEAGVQVTEGKEPCRHEQSPTSSESP